MAHGIEPVLPFDLELATFLVPDIAPPLSTDDLLAIRARQLEKRPADFTAIRDRILASRFTSVRQFKKQHAHSIRDYDFEPGALVLVRNTGSDMDKMKPCYYGPMVVLRRNRNGAYRLGELDGAVSRLCYAAFRLIPYHTRSRSFIPVTRILDRDDLASLEHDDTPTMSGAGVGSDALTQEGQILNPPGGVRTVRSTASKTGSAAAYNQV